MLDHAGRSLRLVLLSQAEPALDLHRFAAAGELVRVSDTDLVMDDDEVAEVLRLGARAAGPSARWPPWRTARAAGPAGSAAPPWR